MAKNHNAQLTHHVIHVGKKYPAERCLQGAGAHLRPKRNKDNDKTNDDSNDDKKPKKSNKSETSTSGQSTSKKPESQN